MRHRSAACSRRGAQGDTGGRAGDKGRWCRVGAPCSCGGLACEAALAWGSCRQGSDGAPRCGDMRAFCAAAWKYGARCGCIRWPRGHGEAAAGPGRRPGGHRCGECGGRVMLLRNRPRRASWAGGPGDGDGGDGWARRALVTGWRVWRRWRGGVSAGERWSDEVRRHAGLLRRSLAIRRFRRPHPVATRTQWSCCWTGAPTWRPRTG